MKSKTTALEDMACNLIAVGAWRGFRLMGMSNTPTNCSKHPSRFSATLMSDRFKQFTAAGYSPVDAVKNALVQEKISRQPWG